MAPAASRRVKKKKAAPIRALENPPPCVAVSFLGCYRSPRDPYATSGPRLGVAVRCGERNPMSLGDGMGGTRL